MFLLEQVTIQPREIWGPDKWSGVSGRIKSGRHSWAFDHQGLWSEGPCTRYGSHSHKNTKGERKIVFTFVWDFFMYEQILMHFFFFFLARLVSLPSYQLSPLSCFRFSDSERTAVRLSLRAEHTQLPGLFEFTVEGPTGSFPEQVLLRGGGRIPPKELCELATSSVHVFPALAEAIPGI